MAASPPFVVYVASRSTLGPCIFQYILRHIAMCVCVTHASASALSIDDALSLAFIFFYTNSFFIRVREGWYDNMGFFVDGSGRG